MNNTIFFAAIMAVSQMAASGNFNDSVSYKLIGENKERLL